MARFSGSVVFVIKRKWVIKPVMLKTISRIQRERVSRSNPWKILAGLFDEDFQIKN